MNQTVIDFLKTRKVEVEKTISSTELFRSKSENDRYEIKLKEELLNESVKKYLDNYNTYNYLLQQNNQTDTTVKSTIYFLSQKDINQLLTF